jgi:two-component system, OmpR family, sensor kinase
LSHEMRTPLTGVRGYLEYLESPSRSEAERRAAVATMHEAVGQMELSLTNALQILRTGARHALRVETVSLDEVAGEALRLFGPTAHSSQVTLTGPAGGPVEVRGDRELLRRVAVNLISNAVLYTQPGGTVLVTVGMRGSEARLAVSDNGPGVAPEDKERIFEKFYRAPGADGRARRIPGSGLGLAIAKQAVEAHGGRIWVESEPGKGSVFHVLLPVKAPAGTPPPVQEVKI